MKNFSTVFVLAFISMLALFSSCKEDKVAPITGSWAGSYFNYGPKVTSNINFNFTANQTLTVLNAGTNNTANGTWTLAGQNFEAKWSEVINGTTLYHSFRAKVNFAATTFTNGTWSQSSSADWQFVSMGTWSMTKL